MRNIYFLFLLIGSSCFAKAQKQEALPIANKEWKTAEQALGLPAGYEVFSCEIFINNKQMILKVGYCSPKCLPQNCMNADQQRFDLLWDRMLKMAKKGDHIVLDNILVKKGDREIKWMSKNYLVP
ncbi:MAG: hypothetical protein U0T74_04465 [Chitinophagales bacterium]